VRKLIAALDNSLATGAVLATAGSLARLFGARLDAVHVGDDRDGIATNAAASAGVELRLLSGPTVPALVEAASDEDVVALVVGTRRLPLGERPVGATALELITSLLKPVVVVPPDSARPGVLARVLVPLEGTASTSLAPKALIELARDANVEIVVVHVHDAATLPAFTDQPQHQARAWSEEFVARYCPWGVGKVTVALRVGRREEEILAVANETECDLIALGWAQELAAGRAPVVREVLERGRIPVLLVPVRLAAGAGAHGPASTQFRRTPQADQGRA
jgi:nucleotide-binding universal stress UspA family protein